MSTAHHSRAASILAVLALLPGLVLTALPAARAAAAVVPLTVSGLQVDYATDPLGIGDTTPSLSWRLNSPLNDERQTAYQILVASNPAALRVGHADVWDSGRVTSGESMAVAYAGPALRSKQRYYWAVRAWDAEGVASAWSASAWWEMGLLTAADWAGAQWVSPQYPSPGTFSDFVLDADFTMVTGVASFVFRAVDESNFDMVQVNSVISPGRVLLRPHIQVNGGWNIPPAVDISSLITQANLHDQHHARIETDHDTITVWIDGVQVDSLTDDSFSAGTIGFRSADSTEDSRYDNLQVHALDGSLLFADDFSVADDEWFPNVPVTAGQLEPPVGVTLVGRAQPASPLLRTGFTLAKPIVRARAYVYGLGFYELHINGAKVGDHVLSPANTNYAAEDLYDTYDVTRQLRRGANAVGLWLGSGYDASFSMYGNRWLGVKQAVLLLDVTYADGTEQTVTTGDGWTWSQSPITADGIYAGESYDARLAQPGWDAAGFDDSAWRPVTTVAAPSTNVSADAMPPMRVTGVLRPVRLTEPQPGVWVYDLGQNIAGWERLRVQGPVGTTITMTTAEELNPDGTLDTTTNSAAASTDRYTLAGTGQVETYEPRFTYHGFRYVAVTGFPGQPTLDSLDGRVVHADVASTGTFDSSDPLLNQIWRNNRWTMLNNSMSTPTDNPVRNERTPPGMDVQAYQDASTREFAMDTFYAKYLGENIAGGGAGAPDMGQDAITLAWTLYEQYGDRASLARAYPGMTASIDAMAAAHPDLVWPDGSANGFGDWCAPDHGDQVNDGMGSPSAGGYAACFSEVAVVNSALWYRQTTDVAQAAQALGHPDDAARYTKLAGQIKDAFNAHFLNAAGDTYGDGRQVTSVLPLAFGLVPPQHTKAVGDQLVHTILDTDSGHLDTGIFGTRYLLDALASIGRIDVAMTILDQTTYPGFGYEISKGATTSWEEWLYSSGMETHDHAMFAGINASFYTDLAGIQPTAAGYRAVTIAPQVPAGLTRASASIATVLGTVSSSWRQAGHTLTLSVVIPVNATAMVHVPTSGGRHVTAPHGARLVGVSGGSAVYAVGSGHWQFVAA